MWLKSSNHNSAIEALLAFYGHHIMNRQKADHTIVAPPCRPLCLCLLLEGILEKKGDITCSPQLKTTVRTRIYWAATERAVTKAVIRHLSSDAFTTNIPKEEKIAEGLRKKWLSNWAPDSGYRFLVRGWSCCVICHASTREGGHSGASTPSTRWVTMRWC